MLECNLCFEDEDAPELEVGLWYHPADAHMHAPMCPMQIRNAFLQGNAVSGMQGVPAVEGGRQHASNQQ